MILVTVEYVPFLVYSQPRDMEGTHSYFLARDSELCGLFGLGSKRFHV